MRSCSEGAAVVQQLLVGGGGVRRTWQSLGPLHSRDDLPTAQPVEGGHEAGGGVREGAVVAGVNGVRLDGLQQGQHRGDQLRHALGHEGASLDWRAGRQLRRVVAGLHALHAVQFFGLAGCAWDVRDRTGGNGS